MSVYYGSIFNCDSIRFSTNKNRLKVKFLGFKHCSPFFVFFTSKTLKVSSFSFHLPTLRSKKRPWNWDLYRPNLSSSASLIPPHSNLPVERSPFSSLTFTPLHSPPPPAPAAPISSPDPPILLFGVLSTTRILAPLGFRSGGTSRNVICQWEPMSSKQRSSLPQLSGTAESKVLSQSLPSVTFYSSPDQTKTLSPLLESVSLMFLTVVRTVLIDL